MRLFVTVFFAISLFTLDAAANLGPATRYPSNNFRFGQTAIGDLNGDGRNDVAVIATSALDGYNSVLIYFQNAHGGLDSAVVVGLSDITLRGIALGDINHDGRTDLAVSGRSMSALSGWLGRIVIFYQDPVTGQFLSAQEHTVSSNTVGDLTIADVNSDEREDIIVLAEWTSSPERGNVSIFYQNTDGTLGLENVYDNVRVRFTGEVHVADMDMDGDNDIVLQSGLLEFAILKQDSSILPGTFHSAPEYYSVQSSYWQHFDSFAVGDINGDGRKDVVVLDPGNNGYVNIFLQNNHGGLDPPVLIVPWGSPPYGIEIADINADGLNDLVGDRVDADFNPDTGGNVFVLYKKSDETFQESVSYPFGTISGGGSVEFQALSIGDVTGDGRPDAVVTWSDEGLYVLPGAGGQTDLAIHPPVLPEGEVGVHYSSDLEISGGSPPYNIQIMGALPVGLDIDLKTGIISGTPAPEAKTAKFTVHITDNGGSELKKRFKIKIFKTVKITTTNLKKGKIGKKYKVAVKAKNGKKPLNWSVLGDLPLGLEFDEASGKITGTPSEPGEFPLTFRVADDLGGVDTQELTVVVNSL